MSQPAGAPTHVDQLPVPPLVAALNAQARRIETPGHTGPIVWRLFGTGRPLALLHGGGGSWMHWVRNIGDLARDYCVIVPDLPGFGDSATPADPADLAPSVADFLSGLDAILGAGVPFSIAGFSYGAMLAGRLAAAAGARAEVLVFVGAAGLGGARGELDLRSWRFLPTLDEKLAMHRHNLAVLMLYDPANIDETALYIQAISTDRSRIRRNVLLKTNPLLPFMPQVRARMAGIWGEHDSTAWSGPAHIEATLRGFQPDCRFDIAPGAGHWVMYEAAPAFNAFIRDVVPR